MAVNVGGAKTAAAQAEGHLHVMWTAAGTLLGWSRCHF